MQIRWRHLAAASLLLLATGAAAVDTSEPTRGATADGAARADAPRRQSARRARDPCTECGHIESMRRIDERPGDHTSVYVDLPTRQSSSNGATREHVVQPHTRNGYELVVRLRAGRVVVFTEAAPRNWQAGDRVTVIDGAMVSSP